MQVEGRGGHAVVEGSSVRDLSVVPAAHFDDAVMRLDGLFVKALRRGCRGDGRLILTEPDCYEVLRVLGVKTPAYSVIMDSKQIAGVVSALPGDEVVLKVVSQDIVHKSDVGGVMVGVPKDEKAVREAYERILRNVRENAPSARIEGVLAAESMDLGAADERRFRELLLGVTLSPEFGPVVLFGGGGRFTESFRDVSRRMAPLSLEDARRMLREVSFAGPLLDGARDMPALAREDELAGLLVHVGDVAARYAQSSQLFAIENIDVNPLAVTADGRLVGLDASVTLVPKPLSNYRVREASIEGLDSMMRPLRVAMIGASADRRKLGGVIFDSICRGNVEAIAINPRAARDGEKVQGRETYASIADIPGQVDLAVVALDAKLCPAVVREIVESGKVRGGIVIESGGFGETKAGAEIEAELKKAVEGSGLRLQGPNCMGFATFLDGTDLNCFFIGPDTMRLPRRKDGNPLVLVSQSGGLISTELCHVETAVGCAAAVSVGNQVDLGPVEYLKYLRRQPDVKVLAFYVESFRPGDGRLFAREAAEARKDGKVVIVYKSGMTEEGAKATEGHTSRMAGEWDVAAAALRQSGVWVTESLGEFDDAMRISSLMAGVNVRGRRVGVTSICGSECVIAVDRRGRLELPEFDSNEIELIRGQIPGFLEVKNPLDLSGGILSWKMFNVIDAMLRSVNNDAVVVGLLPHLPGVFTQRDEREQPVQEDIRNLVPGLIALHREIPGKPMVVCVGGSWMNYGETVIKPLEEAGIPVFTHMERAVTALDGYLNCRLGYS